MRRLHVAQLIPDVERVDLIDILLSKQLAQRRGFAEKADAAVNFQKVSMKLVAVEKGVDVFDRVAADYKQLVPLGMKLPDDLWHPVERLHVLYDTLHSAATLEK